jgi:quercetin dioxygenase-like cupin family protein
MRAVVFTVVILLFLTLSPQVAQAQEQPSAAVVAVAAEQVDWQEAEEGVLMAVLYGDLSSEGHYVIRFKVPPNFEGRPHTHGGTEFVSVQSGTLFLAHGEDLSREAAKSFGPGSFIVLPVGTKMRCFTGEDEVLLDVQGQGPRAANNYTMY